MKVICIDCGERNPLGVGDSYVEEGKVYTVRCEITGFSTYAQREVKTYGFDEIDGLYEQGLFMPLSNLDEGLIHLLNTKPLKKKLINGSK